MGNHYGSEAGSSNAAKPGFVVDDRAGFLLDRADVDHERNEVALAGIGGAGARRGLLPYPTFGALLRSGLDEALLQPVVEPA